MKNDFFVDLNITFEIFEIKNYLIKNLILKLKSKLLEKKNFFKLESIGCGVNFSYILKDSKKKN
jgi:hypothetical protein